MKHFREERQENGKMSLQKLYNDFRHNPKYEYLTSDATVSYVSSGSRFENPEKALEHFLQAEYEVEIHEDIISLHETANSLVLETETRLKFIRGPGAYLPGLSMNFVADEEAKILMVHIVNFVSDENNDSLISSIRYIWDQATLLKQLNVIGSRGNSWPICEADEQIKMTRKGYIPSTDKKRSTTQEPLNNNSPGPFRAWPAQKVNLFNDPPMDQVPIPKKAVEAPSPSAKPPLRTFQEVLNLNDDGQPTTPSSSTPAAAEATYSNNKPIRRSNIRARPQSAIMTLFGSTGGDEEEDATDRYTRLVGSGGAHARKTSTWKDWNN